MVANRYELRSLQTKRMSNSLTCEESRQLLSPPPPWPHVKKRKRKVVPLIKGGFGNGMSSEEAKYKSIIRDKLSDSGDENVDEGTEASAERYAMIAVDHHKKYGNFELVGAGPLAVGNIPDGRIFHLNYKAKNNDVTGAEVQTFFLLKLQKPRRMVLPFIVTLACGQVTHFQRRLILRVAFIVFLIIFTIITPELPFEVVGYYSGRPCVLKFVGLISSWKRECRKEITVLSLSIRELCKREKEYDGTKADFANAALRMFNLEQHTNFVLVRIGSWEVVHLPIGFVYHLNFEAKRNDDPEALVHTLFAQVIDEIDLHGCQYCSPADSSFSPSVRHPPGPGYLIVRETYPC